MYQLRCKVRVGKLLCWQKRPSPRQCSLYSSRCFSLRLASRGYSLEGQPHGQDGVAPAASLEFASGNSVSDHQNNCKNSTASLISETNWGGGESLFKVPHLNMCCLTTAFSAEMCSKVIVLMSSWSHGRLAFIFTLPLTFFIYQGTQ